MIRVYKNASLSALYYYRIFWATYSDIDSQRDETASYTQKKYALIFLKLSTFQFQNRPTQNGYTNIQSFIQKRAEGVVFSPQTLYTSLVGVVYATSRP